MKFLIRTEFSYAREVLIDATSAAKAQDQVRAYRPTPPDGAFNVEFSIISCVEQPPAMTLPVPVVEQTDVQK
jgi:hypothetical protein